MKRIGFVDYYISEWHANNYPRWIAEINQKLGTEYEVAYAWAQMDVSPVTGESTDEWCARMGVERCATAEELAQKSDVMVLLAPSDPEKHLELAKMILPFGKPTYIDKTFAPDLDTAKEIFRIAEEAGTPFFSTSALRYATELERFADAHYLTISGSGSNFAEYIIHLVEMAVVLMKKKAVKVRVEHHGTQRMSTIVLNDGETCRLLFAPAAPYAVLAEDEAGAPLYSQINSEFFKGLMADMIRFFETKQPPFDGKQTLEVMRLRDALIRAESLNGEWVEL